jgi:homoserine dehydrogenase
MVYASSLVSANLPLHVLKFGGSVLANEDALDLAVREIARTRASGARVLAVSSAFRGVTERLLAGVRTRFEAPIPEALASLLATGESTSAAYLSLALADARVENELLDPDRIGLVVRGSALDAEPVGVNVEAIEKAVAARGVAVLPGFYGRRASGGIALLGRGGSDLTALFVAERLGAEDCRLIKNVDGLYTEDPALGGAPQRYLQASWEELLLVGGGVVQKKAVDFARRHRLSFTIASPLSERTTRVGPITRLALESVSP